MPIILRCSRSTGPKEVAIVEKTLVSRYTPVQSGRKSMENDLPQREVRVLGLLPTLAKEYYNKERIG